MHNAAVLLAKTAALIRPEVACVKTQATLEHIKTFPAPQCSPAF